MKRLVICMAVIAGIIVACLYSMHRVDEMKEQVEIYTNAAFTAVEAEDSQLATRRIRELADYWNAEQHILVRFVRHGQIDEITKSVSRLEPLAKYSAYHELSAELSAILWQVEHIWESERISIGNIL